MSGTHWTGDWVGPRAGLDTDVRGKILSPLRGIEPRSPGRPVRRQTLYCLSYPGSHKPFRSVKMPFMHQGLVCSVLRGPLNLQYSTALGTVQVYRHDRYIDTAIFVFCCICQFQKSFQQINSLSSQRNHRARGHNADNTDVLVAV
jgi:hypothetical protein